MTFFTGFEKTSTRRGRRLSSCVPAAHVPLLSLVLEQVVDHQRLSAAGYCYSASAPPFVSAAASCALRILRAEPVLVTALKRNAEFLHKGVSAIRGLEVRVGGTATWCETCRDVQQALCFCCRKENQRQSTACVVERIWESYIPLTFLVS